MNKVNIITLGLWGVLSFGCGHAQTHTCPDPDTTSLKWGAIPPPWIISPFSEHDPQGNSDTHFSKANILVAGYGQGVACTYHMSIGDYTIWWPVITKIPAPIDYRWIYIPGGYICTQGLGDCEFETV